MPPRHHRLLPVDRWLAVLNLLLAASWLPHLTTSGTARWYVAVFLAAALLPALLVRLPERVTPMTAAIRDGYPLAWICLVWGTLGLRMGEGLISGANDILVASWDSALFGAHLHLLWMPAMPWAWFSELMYGVYNAYYLLLVGVPIWFLVSGSPRIARDAILRLAVTYAACFLIYALFPVIGPVEMYGRFEGAHEGAFRQLSWLIREVGNSVGTAFPSSHTAGAIALAWITWRHAPRPVGLAVASLALGVALATVYTQHHWVMDTLAGLVIAGVTQGVIVPWLERGGLRLPGPPMADRLS